MHDPRTCYLCHRERLGGPGCPQRQQPTSPWVRAAQRRELPIKDFTGGSPR